MKMESDLNDSGDAAGSELEARSEEFEAFRLRITTA